MQYPLRSVPANVPVCLHQPPPNTADSRHLRPTKCVVAALRLPMPAPRRLSPPRHPHARLARAAPAAHISVVKVPVPAPNPALASRSVQRRFIQAARKDISTSPQPCQVPISPLTPSGYPRLPRPSLPPTPRSLLMPFRRLDVSCGVIPVVEGVSTYCTTLKLNRQGGHDHEFSRAPRCVSHCSRGHMRIQRIVPACGHTSTIWMRTGWASALKVAEESRQCAPNARIRS